jgi:hypothetical protein
LFILTYQTAVGIISPVEFAKKWENHDLSIRGQQIISYIYLCEQWYANSLAYCNGAETEQKCKIGIRENIPLVFYHIETVGA